jgi:hypothetical protein
MCRHLPGQHTGHRLLRVPVRVPNGRGPITKIGDQASDLLPFPVGTTVCWFRTSEWGVSGHRNGVSQVFGIAGDAQAAGCRSVALSSPLFSPASLSPR